jgi:adenylate cyclase
MSEGAPAVEDASAVHTFFFADLAGFTALTEAHGDERAADLAGDFCQSVRELLPAGEAEVVKSIGDAVLVRSTDPIAAVRHALRIAHDIGAQHGAPVVRVGMHTGPAVERGGDWFGAAVNLAARIAGSAEGGEVLLSDASRERIGDVPDVAFQSRGERRFRNVREPVRVYAAVSEQLDDAGLPIDPVCRMAVDPARTAGSLTYDGTEYHFCSLSCAQAFAAEPDVYAT